MNDKYLEELIEKRYITEKEFGYILCNEWFKNLIFMGNEDNFLQFNLNDNWYTVFVHVKQG